jgi:hypothetical protein
MDEVNAYLCDDLIKCLECNKRFRMLTGKHLRGVHGMTPHDYREKWGLPYTTPLAGQATREIRAEIAKRMHDTGQLDVSHLPRAVAASVASGNRHKSDIARRAQSDLMKKTRPGDHSRLSPGAKRADGRDADRAREYQRKYRKRNSDMP